MLNDVETKRELLPVERTTTRQICSKPLRDVKVLAALASFRKLLQSAYGPTARLKFLQTVAGGHVTVTSSSSVILRHLMSNCHTIIRLIIMAVMGHLDVCSDGGLMTSIMIVRLIESTLELDVPRQLAVEINSHALDVITSYLSSEACRWRMKLDLGDMKSMMCLLRSVINTKPACGLNTKELHHISTVLLRAFLHSLPTSSTTQRVLLTPVQFLRCEGSPVTQTRTTEGVILEAPSLPTHDSLQKLTSGPVKVAVYNVSMATDTDEWSGVGNVAEDAILSDGLEAGVLRQMMDVAMALVSTGVGVVACQKCVHPALKRFLIQQGVYVIDRLSALHIGAVKSLTGASLLSTFTPDIHEGCYGYLQGIEHTIIGNKSYLHLLPINGATHSVSTVILCSPDESSLDELFAACQTAITTLCRTLASPFVVPGGGCLDTHLAWVLQCHASQCSKERLEDLGCTQAQFFTVIKNIARCLEGLASNLEHDQGSHFTDTTAHHHWSAPPDTDPQHSPVTSCMCRLITRGGSEGLEWCAMGDNAGLSSTKSTVDFISTSSENCDHKERMFNNAVIDSLSMKLNSFRTAFETANVILRVNCLVTDECMAV